MPRWLSKILQRIHDLAAASKIRLTCKAVRETFALGLAPDDVREALALLSAGDFAGRLASDATGEWMYVFKPVVGGQTLYVKVVLREDCIVVSFHEDEGGEYEQDD
jgi:hypothetical protein